MSTYRRVVAAFSGVFERTKTIGRVALANGVVKECVIAGGHVTATAGVAKEGLDTDCRDVDASAIVHGHVGARGSAGKKRLSTNGNIVDALAEIEEGFIPKCVVDAGTGPSGIGETLKTDSGTRTYIRVFDPAVMLPSA